jgi:hypothetical protein
MCKLGRLHFRHVSGQLRGEVGSKLANSDVFHSDPIWIK